MKKLDKRTSKVDWCVVDGTKQVMRCTRCGEEVPMKYPIPVSQMVRKIDGFLLMHVDCKVGDTPTDPKQVSIFDAGA